jgi:DMSO/TMAO reductase YedYZ heme-binding membrane subunit
VKVHGARLGRSVGFPALVALVGLLAGWVLAAGAGPAVHSRMLPWILGRGLGVAAYLDLTLLVLLGLWFRHPWRLHRPIVHPAVQIRAHALLAVACGLLVLGHVVAMVADSYARVGWVGAMLPGASGYRPFAVALGSVSLYLCLVVGLSARFAGRLTGRHWLVLHRLALVAFALGWGHSVLTGSDVGALRPLFAVSGAAVALLAASRLLAAAPSPHASRPGPDEIGGVA